MTTILGIESSCDETSAAVVVDGHTMLSNVVASQIDLHAQYGGVFPELASRAHIEAISAVVKQALNGAGVTLDDIDAVAVTRGPGLAGSLLVGVNYAKGLALGRGLPLVGVNHLEGHVYSLWLIERETPITFPVVCLIVSGGHSEIVLITGHGEYTVLGSTIDDAAGEAYDKVARLLGLAYPGGPVIERTAREGNATAYHFPRALSGEGYNFSFSGLKTAVLRAVQPPHEGPRPPKGEGMTSTQRRDDVNVPDVAASFQAAVVDVLVDKTVHAAREHGATEIWIAGGVSANQALRAAMNDRSPVPVRVPPMKLCVDNAAMIAAAGYFRYIHGYRDDQTMDILPMWPLVSIKDAMRQAE
ncbi:MAG TPA: tRNA (adenosine(37)-N6)-threonylcarbamoyltransferase complex transferase subunit TsaD [Aggregatilinea sp.]|uniref:tRNA (adenosine(37)-N6)-threonylcarbamoyltransferase complex transferase subunit TsaD n=1 Tax=Aggregatilinea sp. TaxID=2806333 RepID=UPI002C20864B|nr:tRNA (adenosine(37)-N6)-threonylcarbamoyltransferase complex transferase subunit TsaD [Aggregatilinea sp.]HML21269.1 tRNA (adenosine(37)-N6)-threonylcarbamoyltransferase complex transferase subunit TsaD [Aggregatilinea sp.]